MDREIIQRSLKNLTFSIKPDPTALANLATAMKELNLIERVPRTDEYLDMSLVNEL
jgi:hypothetical protein